MAESKAIPAFPPPSRERRARLRVLHVAKAKLKLSDDDYRDKLQRLFNVRSARDLTDRQLDEAITAFHVKQSVGGSTPHPHLRKVRALWIALGNLGEVDPSDTALDAFVQRQTGKQRLAFLSPVDAGAVVEALKAMCARAGFVIPVNDPGGIESRRALLRAQWKKLADIGAVKDAHHWAQESWASRRFLNCHGASVTALDKVQLDEAARTLGKWIRKELNKRGSAAESAA